MVVVVVVVVFNENKDSKGNKKNLMIRRGVLRYFF